MQLILQVPRQACARALEAFRQRRAAHAIDITHVAYRRLVAQFDVELTSFERKRYDNLSHEPNKAMNLNSYIALLGGTFRKTVRDRKLLLERSAGTDADLLVPASEFLLAVDADSVLTPDYALRLVHVMREHGHEDVAIVQAPITHLPGPRAL